MMGYYSGMECHSILSHHIKALPPAIRVMESLGFTAQQCLLGTGLNVRQLELSNFPTEFSLEQEFRFHRNLLELTGDPLLGLKLGQAYHLECYGLLGYAFLSAPTLRQALIVIRKYGPLAFSLFNLDFQVKGQQGILRFSRQIEVPDDLLTFFVDRDLAAVLLGATTSLQERIIPLQVNFMHDNEANREEYSRVFDCPLAFNTPDAELCFPCSYLDAPMPMRDPEASEMLQQQCDLMLARMSKAGGVTARVRQLILARPGYFPDIDHVAEKFGMSSRNLRRKLTEEGNSYKQVLDDVRYQLAREYLGTSGLPLQEISVLLGYSTPGNFSHAFKRWHGDSPREYRKENR